MNQGNIVSPYGSLEMNVPPEPIKEPRRDPGPHGAALLRSVHFSISLILSCRNLILSLFLGIRYPFFFIFCGSRPDADKEVKTFRLRFMYLRFFLFSQRSFDEASEQRMGFVRPALEFRMELYAHKKILPGDLHRFHQPFIRRQPRQA